jgi:hypothetical protein
MTLSLKNYGVWADNIKGGEKCREIKDQSITLDLA